MVKLEQPVNSEERYLYAIVLELQKLNKNVEKLIKQEEKSVQKVVKNDKIEKEEKPVKRTKRTTSKKK